MYDLTHSTQSAAPVPRVVKCPKCQRAFTVLGKTNQWRCPVCQGTYVHEAPVTSAPASEVDADRFRRMYEERKAEDVVEEARTAPVPARSDGIDFRTPSFAQKEPCYQCRYYRSPPPETTVDTTGKAEVRLERGICEQGGRSSWVYVHSRAHCNRWVGQRQSAHPQTLDADTTIDPDADLDAIADATADLIAQEDKAAAAPIFKVAAAGLAGLGSLMYTGMKK